MSWPYDYIIIGAGSAGCAIANRLAEDYVLNILILEAGPPDNSFMLKMPAGFASLGDKTPYNWRYETVPQKHCNDRRMYWPRGKTLGGSSSINAMLYVRGNAWDYDHWRQLGNEGWSYRDVLPFFKKAENNERGGDDFHGTGGPLNVADQVDPSKLNDGFLKACEQAGHKRVKDFNGASQEGVGYYQVTQKDKQRWSTASAYLRPAVERNKNNVKVISNALVERIILDGNRAMGVRYVVDGRDEVARCSREIILSGGAVNSPQLLMLSGIGPADHLKSVGIRCLHDLPGVGGNLQDHLDAALLQFCKTRDTYDTANKLWSLYQYWRNKKGPGTSPIAETGGFLSTQSGLSAPDIQLHFLPVLVVDHGRTKMKKNGYSLHVCTLRPESTGTIRLKSKDPKEHPLIDANYLAERKRPRHADQGREDRPRDLRPVGPRSLSRRRVPARRGGQDRCRDRAMGARQVRDDLSPGRHLQDGRRQRHHGGGRQPVPGARDRGPARGRRLGDADAGRRQHQRAHHHDRRARCRPSCRARADRARAGTSSIPPLRLKSLKIIAGSLVVARTADRHRRAAALLSAQDSRST